MGFSVLFRPASEAANGRAQECLGEMRAAGWRGSDLMDFTTDDGVEIPLADDADPDLREKVIASLSRRHGWGGVQVVEGSGAVGFAGVSPDMLERLSMCVVLDGYKVFPPVGYAFEGQALHDSSGVKICPGIIAVVGRVLDLESDHQRLRVAWESRGSIGSAVIERDHAFSSGGVRKLAKLGAPTTQKNARLIAEFLAEQEQADLRRLPETWMSNRCGWIDRGEPTWLDEDGGFSTHRRSFLSGERCTGDLEVVYQRPTTGVDVSRGFRETGALSGWQDAMRLLEPYPIARLAVTAALGAPLLDILGAQSFVLHLGGSGTSTGKSTCIEAAASVVGAPHEVMHTWGASLAAFNDLAVGLPDHPLFFDDTKLARGDKEKIAHAVYDFTQGAPPARSGRQRAGGQQRGILLSSGEQVIWEGTAHAGLRARCLVVRDLPFGAQSEEMRDLTSRVREGIERNHGHALSLFARYILDRRSKWRRWRDYYRRMRVDYAHGAPRGVGDRLAGHAAVLHVTHRAGCRAGLLPWSEADPLADPLWSKILEEAKEGDPASEALEMLQGWAERHRHLFEGGGVRVAPKDCVGRWDYQGHLCIARAELEPRLKGWGYEPAPILDAWKAQGLLLVEKGRKYEANVRLFGPNKRLVCVRVGNGEDS